MTKGMHCTLCAAILTVLLGLGACSVPDPCDPGFREDYGVCLAIEAPMPDAGGDGDGDGDGDGEGDGDEDAGIEADASMEPEPPEFEFICPAGGNRSVFGRECSSMDDCECPASICLPEPFNSCSGTQCNEPGRECPADMTCTDIRPFRDSASIEVPDEVTHVCL